MLKSLNLLVRSLLLTPTLILPLFMSSQALAAQLVGRAVLNADTFAPGPTSGQLTGGGNGFTAPYVNEQPVQGVSAVVAGPKPNTFIVLSDNGFGAKANSPDYLLRAYTVEPDFSTGQVFPVNRQTGERISNFTSASYLQLNDRANNVGFPIVAEQTVYPGSITASNPSGIPVAPEIQEGRLLTGGDFDLESFRRVNDGTFWFGEEFGPFLLHTNAKGQLIDPPIPLPNFTGLGGDTSVQSPDNPFLGNQTANLPRSGGFEGLALNASGNKLYAMLEGALTPDPQRDRRLINEFDIETKQYTGRVFSYRMEDPSYNIGELTAINDKEFIVIERDNNQGDPNNPAFSNPAQFKRLYKVDISDVDSEGFVAKELLVDLLNIADPNGIGGNGTTNGIFTFPFVTIESVLPLDEQTLLVINDNNFPGSVGRTPNQADSTEFIKIRLDQPLALGATPVPEGSDAAGLGLVTLSGIMLLRRIKA